MTILDPYTYPDLDKLAARLFEKRQRRGVTPARARQLVLRPTTFGLLLVELGLADGLVGGIGKAYADMVKPSLQIIGPRPGVKRVSAAMACILKNRLLILSDTAINIEPDADTLAEMAIQAAETAESLFDLQPKVALISFSNFGSVNHPEPDKVAAAMRIVRARRPDLVVDGEMMVDTALSPEVAAVCPQSLIQGDANVLVFPSLDAGNAAYKLLRHAAGAEIVGPILCGLAKPVNLLNHVASTDEIVRSAAITALQAARLKKG